MKEGESNDGTISFSRTASTLDRYGKFDVSGFDIYDRIEDELSYGCLVSYEGINENMTEDKMKKIRNPYIELFSEENWRDIKRDFNGSRKQ